MSAYSCLEQIGFAPGQPPDHLQAQRFPACPLGAARTSWPAPLQSRTPFTIPANPTLRRPIRSPTVF